jgi:hypothetical protein
MPEDNSVVFSKEQVMPTEAVQNRVPMGTIRKIPGHAHFKWLSDYFEWDGAAETLKIMGQNGVLHNYTGMIHDAVRVEKIESTRFGDERSRRSKELRLQCD